MSCPTVPFIVFRWRLLGKALPKPRPRPLPRSSSAAPDAMVPIDDIRVPAPQTSIGNTSCHLDAGCQPPFPFGHGLSYTTVEYSSLRLDAPKPRLGEVLAVSVDRACFGRDITLIVEPGDFHARFRGRSEAGPCGAFRLAGAPAKGVAS